VKGLGDGDPNDPETAIGPIINKRQLDGLLHRIEQARSSGLQQVLGGKPEGLVLLRHVFLEVGNGTEFAQAEQFGPVVPLIRAEARRGAPPHQRDAIRSLERSVHQGRAARPTLRFRFRLG
jgi:aldehyde dehydrogenase (NAD+)